MCKISVVVPVYNSEKTLNRCINSVLGQSFKDFELIIINDGSTDNSHNLCLELCEKDNRIKYIRRENGGLSSVRNLGIKEAKGQYIYFIDSDDYIDSQCLEFMLNKAEKDLCHIVLCGYFIENGKKTTQNKAENILLNSQNINSAMIELKSKNLIDPAWNKLYKTDFLRNCGLEFPNGEYYEDTFFNISLLKFSPIISVSNKCFYHYVLHLGSITRRYNKEKLETIKQRARLLKQNTKGIEEYCDFYYIKSVFSSVIDMFFCLEKSNIKAVLKSEKNSNEFIRAANNAQYKGIGSKLIIFAAKSKGIRTAYLFCKMCYILKYKMQGIFLRVKDK